MNSGGIASGSSVANGGDAGHAGAGKHFTQYSITR